MDVVVIERIEEEERGAAVELQCPRRYSVAVLFTS
jgi:hypothetical protein